MKGRTRARMPSISRGLAVACLCGLFGSTAPAQSPGFRVIDSDGFKLGGDSPKRGQLLEIGQLTGERGAQILLSCGAQKFVYVCDHEKCSIPACAAASANGVKVRPWGKASGAEHDPVVRGLAGVIRRAPKPAPVAAARNLGDITDAVVLKDEKGLHLAPALSRVFEGSHCLLVEQLPAGGRTWTSTVEWDRVRNAEGLTAPIDLPVGLYAFREGPSAPGPCRPATDEAGWVLVVGPDVFATANDEWQQQAAEIEELERDAVSPTLLRTARRAILASLAER